MNYQENINHVAHRAVTDSCNRSVPHTCETDPYQDLETRVDEIHAACFVAASGDNRLTTTQCYIDFVLSIFGKDVENIRLLVTFADNAHPPVVEACLAANFPVTSASDAITFSKFNCSVLYASNQQREEDGPCFDKLFWDMGQENFHKFFTMLEGMTDKDLKSTRNVIQSCGLLEQSLKDIEQELEVCFVKIENMEMFQRKMNTGTRWRPTRISSLRKRKCAKLSFFVERNTARKKCEFCTCPASEHEYQTFEWRLTQVKIPIIPTLKDMKAEYESNYDRKVFVEQLLADYSHMN
ncbi:hypothetical protein DAPPUDRAFT_332446 [Daphnia pulex]|uniref:Uncharacterized protein n=1 Tax=Daphnia pulex TaxID=6669 RepID=E9HPZ7_DAPPU|nr:hypothetical protein DAPPUDRAFT_332446 [Daphnia pulex]|eukprot:EFX66183.1 hypothetical protein DAPPUDRAFT_332446 [Daphnia pulex]